MLLALLGCSLVALQDPDFVPGEVAFLEWSTDDSHYVVQQNVELTLRFGFEREFLAQRLVPLFHRPLDLSVQVQAPWLAEAERRGVTTLPATAERLHAATTFALDDRIETAAPGPDREQDGRVFRTFEWRRTLRAKSPVLVDMPPALLRFAHATSFRTDFLGDRIPEDRRDASVFGNRLTFLVEALPEDGRPRDFTGAVGSFVVSAAATPRILSLGETLRLALTIEGNGNLGSFAAPRLDHLAGFDVLGTIAGNDSPATPSRVTILYDLRPTSETTRAVPSLSLPYFEPGIDGPGAYRRAETEPLPLVVRPPVPLAGEPVETEAPGDPGEDALETRRPLLLALGAALALGALWLLRRRPADGRARACTAAAARFRADLARADADLLLVLDDFLGALLDCPATSIHGTDLAERLRTAGIPEGLAQRTQSFLDDLLAQRYGGRPATNRRDEARALVEALERVLAPR